MTNKIFKTKPQSLISLYEKGKFDELEQNLDQALKDQKRYIYLRYELLDKYFPLMGYGRHENETVEEAATRAFNERTHIDEDPEVQEYKELIEKVTVVTNNALLRKATAFYGAKTGTYELFKSLFGKCTVPFMYVETLEDVTNYGNERLINFVKEHPLVEQTQRKVRALVVRDFFTKIRKDLKLNIKEFSETTGISIYSIKTGENFIYRMSENALKDYAKYLTQDVHELAKKLKLKKTVRNYLDEEVTFYTI